MISRQDRRGVPDRTPTDGGGRPDSRWQALRCDGELLCCLGPAFPPLAATDPARIRRIAAELADGLGELFEMLTAQMRAELSDTAMISDADANRLQLTDDPDQVLAWVDAAWHAQPGSRSAAPVPA
jgi:hypothetical protein